MPTYLVVKKGVVIGQITKPSKKQAEDQWFYEHGDRYITKLILKSKKSKNPALPKNKWISASAVKFVKGKILIRK